MTARKVRKPTMPLARCKVIDYLGGNRVRWRCNDAGHEFVGVGLPKKRGIPLPSEAGLAQLVGWWQKQPNGIRHECPKCLATAKAA